MNLFLHELSSVKLGPDRDREDMPGKPKLWIVYELLFFKMDFLGFELNCIRA